MKILVDTHVVIWWFREPKKLSSKAQKLMSDSRNMVLVSAASAFEIATKENMGKLDWRPFVVDLERHIEEAGFLTQPVTIEHSIRAGLLPFHHRDPFDRLLVAQAQSLNAPILSTDSMLDQYGVQRIW